MAKKPAAAPAAEAPKTEVVDTPHGEVEMTAEDKQVAAEIRRHATSTAAPDVTAFLSPEEQKLKKEIDEAIARGEDPLGDDEPIVRTQEEADEANAAEAAAREAAKAAKAAAATEEDDGEADEGEEEGAEGEGEGEEEVASAEALAAVAGEEAPAAAAAAAAAAEADPDALPAEMDLAAPTLTKVEDPKKLTDAVEAAQAKLDDIEAKWTKQEITDEDRAAQLKVARRELSTATRAESRNDTLIETNRNAYDGWQQQVINGVVKLAKTEATVDYAKDAKAQKQFNSALQVIASDEDNKDKSYPELVLAAHRMVCAQRSVAPKKPATPAAAPAAQGKPAAAAKPAAGTPPARVPPKAPVTLRDMPTAQTQNVGGDTLGEQLGRLKGKDFEAAWARLTPTQRAQFLDD